MDGTEATFWNGKEQWLTWGGLLRLLHQCPALRYHDNQWSWLTLQLASWHRQETLRAEAFDDTFLKVGNIFLVCEPCKDWVSENRSIAEKRIGCCRRNGWLSFKHLIKKGGILRGREVVLVYYCWISVSPIFFPPSSVIKLTLFPLLFSFFFFF